MIILFGNRFRVGESSSWSLTSASASRESRSASEGSTGTLSLRSCEGAGHMVDGEGETTSLLPLPLGGTRECICGRLAVRRTSGRKKGTESKCDDGVRFSGVVSSESIDAIDDAEDTVLR